jgi:flagellin
MSQLIDEIDRISNTTQFNNKNVLDGSMSGKVAADSANVLTNSSLASTTTGTDLLTALTDDNGDNLGIKEGDVIKLSWAVNGEIHTASVTVGAATDLTTLLGNITGTTDAVSATTGDISVTSDTKGYAGAVEGLTFEVSDADGNEKAEASKSLSDFSETTAAKEAKAVDGRATLQIGANAGQTMKVTIGDMGADALGISNLDLSSQDGANVAISVIDEATKKVSSQRSYLGAVQNRLEHTINNLNTAAENLSSAQSQIADIDMASEMMTYSKNNVLSQAAQAMLAQANQQPQQVLQLLR